MAAFLGPVGQVKIFDRVAGREVLLGPPEFPFLTGITISLAAKAVRSISFSVDAPYEEGKDLLLDSTLFSINNLVAARIGYASPGWFTPWFYGVLSQGGQGISISPDGVSGNISATNIDHLYVREVGGNYDVVDPSKSVADIISEHAVYLGFDVVFGEDAKNILTAERPTDSATIVYGTRSHWEAIYDLCIAMNCTFWTGVRSVGNKYNETLYVFTFEEALRQAPVRVFVMRGKFDPMQNMYPIESLSTGNETAVWASSFLPDDGASGVRVSDISDIDGKVEEVKLLSKDSNQPTSGDSVAPTPTDATVQDKVIDKEYGDKDRPKTIPVKLKDGAKRESKLRRLEAYMAKISNGMQATITTLGIPDQLPLENIGIVGCGKRYDGTYLVKQVTHEWTSGGYTMTLEAFKTGTYKHSIKEEKHEQASPQEVPGPDHSFVDASLVGRHIRSISHR